MTTLLNPIEESARDISKFVFRTGFITALWVSLLPIGLNAQARADFSKVDLGLPGLTDGSIAIGDYDGDRDLDFLMSGENDIEMKDVVLIENALAGYDISPESFIAVSNGDLAWGDMDGDNDLDLLVSGTDGDVFWTKIYENNPGRTPRFEACTDLEGVLAGAAAWGDLDNDGDLDLVLSGRNNDRAPVLLIYLNLGSCTFSLSPNNLPGIFRSHVTLSDYDLDQDLDLFAVGRDLVDDRKSVALYTNENGLFTLTDTSFVPVDIGWAEWGDYDRDGDPDLFVNGKADTIRNAMLYLNEGGLLQPDAMFFEGTEFGKGVFMDLENDGSAGLLYTGRANDDLHKSYYYQAGLASSIDTTRLAGAQFADLAAADLNNDRMPDVLLVGSSDSTYFADLFMNTLPDNGEDPLPPGNLRVQESGDGAITFLWDHGSGSSDLADSLGITYNLRVGVTDGGHEIVPAMALQDGFRLIPARGNAGQNLKWTLRGLELEPGQFIYWGVQTISLTFAGSSFTTGAYAVNAETETLPETSALTVYPNPLSNRGNIRLQMNAPGHASIRLVDMLGRVVIQKDNTFYPAGEHTLPLEIAHLAAGIYTCILESENAITMRSLVKL